MARIIIIENNKDDAVLAKDYLEINGHSVEIEMNGEAAFERIENGEFDCVVTNVNISRMDGFTICKSVRKDMDIPILFLSDRTAEIDLIRGFGLGADDYIKKPFSPNELVARVKAHLARYKRLKTRDSFGEEDEDNTIEIGNIRLDKLDHRVFVQGEEKTLTNKEYDLLLFLMEHPNHVFSKEELFQQIWGMESMGELATVTVHIKKIREKIEKVQAKPRYIETIWGVGYRFKCV